jgi:ferredoxin
LTWQFRLLEGEAMKVWIDPQLCQGHAMCALACAQVFRLSDEDGHAMIDNEIVPPEFEDAVELAARSCPEGAIQTTGKGGPS